MSKKVSDALGSLNYEDLVELQRDLFSGGATIKSMISNRIKEINETQTKVCATCGNTINLNVNHEYTLIFGPNDFKKRASFCAIDCLEYFFIQLKQISEKRLQSSKQEQ